MAEVSKDVSGAPGGLRRGDGNREGVDDGVEDGVIGASRFRHVSLLRFVADVARTVELRVRERPARRIPERSRRLVVTLTTVPARAGRLRPVLRSLLDQTEPPDRIVVAWPATSLRDGRDYPPPPPDTDRVRYLRCADHGPATKILEALRAEPDAALVVVDDDVIYPRDFLEVLWAAHRADPLAAVGYRGIRLRPDTNPLDLDHIYATAVDRAVSVDILMGTWGYLVPPGSFDEAVHDFASFPPEARWVDDVWFSGHLARRGVSRRVVPATSFPIERATSRIAALDRGPNRTGRNDAVAIAAFAQWW